MKVYWHTYRVQKAGEDREMATGAVQDVQAEDPEAEDQNAQEGAL